MSTNFKGEEFPKNKNLEYFICKIKEVESSIANNKIVQEVLLKENQNIIPKIGAYFFYDTKESKIVYVGISRNVRQRLQQHVNHKASSSASLAYLMAKENLKGKSIKDIKKCFEKSNEEKNCRQRYQEKIRGFKVDFIEFNNNFEMALFEIYAAIKLESYWNSFKTH